MEIFDPRNVYIGGVARGRGRALRGDGGAARAGGRYRALAGALWMKRRDRSVNRRARPAAHRALAVRRPRNFQVGQSDQWLLSCRHGVVHVGGVGGEHPVCGGHRPCLVSNWGFSRSPSTVVRLDFADSGSRGSWFFGVQ